MHKHTWTSNRSTAIDYLPLFFISLSHTHSPWSAAWSSYLHTFSLSRSLTDNNFHGKNHDKAHKRFLLCVVSPSASFYWVFVASFLPMSAFLMNFFFFLIHWLLLPLSRFLLLLLLLLIFLALFRCYLDSI